jgi:hypothetical protein
VTADRLSLPAVLVVVVVVVVVPIGVALFAAVLRQLTNLLSDAFVEVPVELPVEDVAVLPVVELLLLLLFFAFASNTEVLRLPAVTSAIAMTMATVANMIDVLFGYIVLYEHTTCYNILIRIFLYYPLKYVKPLRQ